MSEHGGSVIKIKPSLVPFAWKGFVLILLGVIVYVATSAFKGRLQSLYPSYLPSSILDYAVLGLVGLGFLGVLVGVARRNMFT